jgi:A/G-specific adenine glycosylase
MAPLQTRGRVRSRGRRAGAGAGGGGAQGERDEVIVGELCAWFGRYGRDLPWRRRPGHRRDPYLALVSEVMLQQTQVSRVLEKFGPFVERFGSIGELAAAHEDEVLALWSGMGYYRRARALHAAARTIVERHGGEVPSDAVTLRALPGVGRYTAGAIASIVFGAPEPTVDGNIARVLLRVEGREVEHGAGLAWAWKRAAVLARCAGPQRRGGGAGVFNEAMMELGATVCAPRLPRCGACPVRALCRAHASGRQERIPRPKVSGVRSVLYCAAVVLRDDEGRLLVERRGDAGMWAGLWQVPTIESAARAPGRVQLERVMGLRTLRRIVSFEHATTHRDVRFAVWHGRPLACAAAARCATLRGAIWMDRAAVAGLAMSSAQRQVLTRAGAAEKWKGCDGG